MRYLFCGSFCQSEEEKQLMKWSKCGLQSSIINFQRNMLQGVRDSMTPQDTLDIINYYPLGTYKHYSSIWLLSGESKKGYRRLDLLNIPLLKQIFYNLQAAHYIRQWVNKYKEEEKTILMYDLLTPYLKALSRIKSNKLTKCSIVADLPNEFGYQKGDKGIKAKVKQHIGRRSLKQLSKLDRYGLLTRQMSEVLMIPKDKFVVIEGFSNASRTFSEMEKKDKIIILYSGVVSKTYQLDVLVNAFKMIDSKDMELWICGSGNYVRKLKEEIGMDKRIKYWGSLPTEEVARLQSESSILINPRQNKGEYTKYSFPSKIIEYLSAARPVIAYKLDGIPDEYYEFIISPQNDTPEELCNTILSVTRMPFEKRKKLGLEGRNFVINRTNPCDQITKLFSRLN